MNLYIIMVEIRSDIVIRLPRHTRFMFLDEKKSAMYSKRPIGMRSHGKQESDPS